MPRYYLTTAIDYANGDPHAGHAFEKIGADVVARYRRRLGDDVLFAIGMDEHGQSIVQEAERRGIAPQELVDEMAGVFRGVWDRLEISYDEFIRTTEERHHRAVRAILERVRDAGDLYRDTYEGYYCVRCEAFKKEDDLEDGRCPVHPDREITWTEEENYFFRLSTYRDPLLEHLRAHPEFIRPESRRNEILRLLEGGLDDVSASRSRIRWGTPFPGEEEHTVYVWLDALTNYLSAVGFPADAYREWWPAELHVIGKDITRFHCVIWPALLMSAGLELPATVWGHGFVSVAGGKISKSAGARLDLSALVERHGPDAFRYFMMREAHWDGDRDFPSPQGLIEAFDARYESELANDLGNLLNRVVSMVEKYRDGEVRAGGETALDDARRRSLEAYHAAMKEHLLHRGLEAALDLVRRANGFVDEAQPWTLAKREREAAPNGGNAAAGERDRRQDAGSPADDGGVGGDGAGERLDAVLGSLVRTLATVAVTLEPFLPGKSRALWRQLGGHAPLPTFEGLTDRTAGLERVRGGDVLFPRQEVST